MKKTPGKRNSPHELTVGEVSKRSGATVSAIHFYEHKGLIVVPRGAARRRYSTEVLRRIVMIKSAQRVGTPLRVIRELLQLLPDDRPASAQDWLTLLDHWVVDIDRRIEHLAGLRKELDFCITCGCLSFESCPLLERAPGRPPARGLT